MGGVGGVIWDEVGNHILSFSRPVGFCSVNKAELVALRIGH